MKRIFTAVALASALVSGHAFAAAEPKTEFDAAIDVRYLKDMKVVPVSDKTPEGLKKFAGRWAGQYNGVMNVIITFENLDDPNNVMYVHSVGITPAYNILRKLTARPKEGGKFDAATGTITTNFAPNQTMVFKLTEDGYLQNVYEEKGQWKSEGLLKRIQDLPGQPSGAPVPAPFKMTESAD